MAEKNKNRFQFDRTFFDTAALHAGQALNRGSALGGLLEKYAQFVDAHYTAGFSGQVPNSLLQLEALTLLMLNEANGDGFSKAGKKIILYPRGLAVKGSKCKRKKGKFGTRCTHCTSKCRLSLLMKKAESDKYGGFFFGRDIFKQLNSIRKKNKNVGIIFVADLLSINNFMRLAAMLNIPARGILTPNINCHEINARQLSRETISEQFQMITGRRP